MGRSGLGGMFRSLEKQVLAEATKRGIAGLGMKSLGGSGEIAVHGAVTAEEGLRYAMSLPVATTISGMDSLVVLEQNLRVARGFQPFAAGGKAGIRARGRTLAAHWRDALFLTA